MPINTQTMFQEAIDQLKKLMPTLVILYLPAFGLLVLVALASYISGVPVSKFTGDPALVMRAHPLVGVVSNIGVLLWSATVTICFFSAAHIRRKDEMRELYLFLLASGFFTMLLMFDDLFMLHDELFPEYLHFPQNLVYLVYMGIALFYLFRYRASILKTDYVLFFLALGFFALSVGMDFVQPNKAHALLSAHYLFEDGFKLLGITGWLGYFARTAFRAVG